MQRLRGFSALPGPIVSALEKKTIVCNNLSSASRLDTINFHLDTLTHTYTHTSTMASDEIVWQIINQQFCTLHPTASLPLSRTN